MRLGFLNMGAVTRRGGVTACLLFLLLCGAFPAAAQEGRSANEVLHLALQGRAWLRSVYASASMRIRDRQEKFTLGIKTEIFAQKPHNLRIQASKLMGRMEVFDAVVLGDTVGVYVPRKKTLYHGTLDDLEHAQMQFHPEEIARQMLRPDVHLLVRSWRFGQQVETRRSRRGAPTTLVLLENVVAGKEYWRVTVESGSFRLLQVEQLTPQGEQILVKTYSRYRVLESTDGPPELDDTGHAFPYKVELSWPQKERSITIKFKEVEPEPHLGQNVFTLVYDPDRTKVEPLGAVEIENDEDAESGATPETSFP